MGKISILTSEQKKVLSFVNESEYFRTRFYFTGRTALSEYYLHHRYSEDLDFFSEQAIEPDILFTFVNDWAKRLHATIEPRLINDQLYLCMFTLLDGTKLKVDICYYPHNRLKPEKPSQRRIAVDSLFDIAVNKFTTIGQRITVKDFVDLYYLMNKFGFWDLSYGAEKKFRVKFDPILLSSDILTVETFDTLPRMIKPLKLETLKAFFRTQAKILAASVVE